MFYLPVPDWANGILGERTIKENTYLSQQNRKQALRLARVTHCRKGQLTGVGMGETGGKDQAGIEEEWTCFPCPDGGYGVEEHQTWRWRKKVLSEVLGWKWSSEIHSCRGWYRCWCLGRMWKSLALSHVEWHSGKGDCFVGKIQA